jgi:SNF2 family DNA or RNA helicase
LLSRHDSGLLLDPGLGKTSTYLAYICTLMERKTVKRTLVCAPMRVAKTVWPFEAEKWSDFSHLKIADLTEKSDPQREELLRSNYDIYVINPESLHRVLNPNQFKKDVDNRWKIDMLIVDESTRFADAQTMRFKALKPCLDNFAHVNIATGTPTPNGLHQLFGQVYLLDQGASLGSYITHFRQMYMRPHPYIQYSYEMNPGAERAILDKVAHLLLRMRNVDNIQMPELIHNTIYVNLPKDVQRMYEDFERDFLIKVQDETIPAFNKASLGIKCRQIANGFIYSQENKGESKWIHDQKLDALAGLVEEMQGRPLLVMYEFIADGERIMKKFPDAVNVTGCKNIEGVVRDFNAGKIPMLIGHPRSAGHGLNLQESCSDICWFGVTWDLELWIQAIARVWRQGQPSPVVKNHVIVASNTTDAAVIHGLTRKEADQSRVDQALISYARQKLG